MGVLKDLTKKMGTHFSPRIALLRASAAVDTVNVNAEQGRTVHQWDKAWENSLCKVFRIGGLIKIFLSGRAAV